MKSVSVIGNATTDLFVVTKDEGATAASRQFRFPLGAKLQAKQMRLAYGGFALNTARTLVNSGLMTTVITQLGEDEASSAIKKLAKHSGFTIRSSDNKCDVPMSVVFTSGHDRTIFTYAKDYPYDDLAAQVEAHPTDWIVLGPLHGPAEKLYQAVEAAIIGHKTRLAVIPSLFQLEHDISALRALLRLTDVLICNQDEAISLTHGVARHDVKRMAAMIEQLGPAIVTITSGAEGAIVKSGEIYESRKAVPVTEVVDTTGAGDAYGAGFLSVLIHYDIWDEAVISGAIKLGLENAGAEITQLGGGSGILSKPEFKEFFRKNFDEQE